MTKPSRTRFTGAATAVALSLLLAVACSKTPVAPTTTAPPGYDVRSGAKVGFALAVPSDWTTIPLNPNTDIFNKSANTLRLANPKLASILNKARIIGESGGAFMAVSPDGVADVNLTVDKPKEKTVDQIVTNSVASLNQNGATKVTQSPTTLSGKPAITVSFTLPVDTDAGTVPTDETQFYLLQNGKAYILTISAAPAGVAQAVATSLVVR